MNVSERVWRHKGEEKKELYHYKGCGLDDIYLISGYDIENTPYGGGVRIRHLEKLHEAIGLYLIKNRKVLRGKELRFLRHQMDLTQSELARLLGSNAQQVARYEKDQCDISGPADRIIRLLFKEHVGQKSGVRRVLDTFDRMDDANENCVLFREVNDGWQTAQRVSA